MNAECEVGDGVSWEQVEKGRLIAFGIESSAGLSFICSAVNRISSLVTPVARLPFVAPVAVASPRTCHGRDNNVNNHRMRSGGRSPRAWTESKEEELRSI